MASIPSRANWLKLYKDLQRASIQLPQYSFRHFARRRVRDYFEKFRSSSDSGQLSDLYKQGEAALETIRRQTLISSLYPYRPLVVEQTKIKAQQQN